MTSPSCSQSGSLEFLLQSSAKEVRQGFSVSQSNQKGIQEVCEGLANKIDLLAQRTQFLEIQVEQLKVESEKNSRDIVDLKAKNKYDAEKLESLENSARRNNIKLMNVPEGKEGNDIKTWVVDLLMQSGVWDGTESILKDDIQRVHEDPFRKAANRVKPRRILVNFLTYTVKEKILSKALKMGTLKVNVCSFEIRSDVLRITSNRQ
ncbi:hypothetical protein NDU88_005113 [Pleurodeles waltl]|uniref:L1 transposable element RRM domain-containing protein n=1 Tax=Pleurodeles waltl TaxID=8319 RepID=A0AAV7WA56_PLEWA|nr:hypothetical protein NDU88_005113 [Pleurodeles waltl]